MNPAYPDLLPVMSDEEYHNLKADIERSGLQIPIEIDAETREILDGWHRYKACRELGITLSAGQMRERRFSSEEERKWFCISLNLNRRHLSQSQKAAFIVEYKLGPEREKAKERQRLNGRQSWGKKSNPPILGDSIPRHGAATEILAQTFQVGHATIEKTARLKRVHPQGFAKVLAGVSNPRKELELSGVEKTQAQRKAEKKARTDLESFSTEFLAALKRKRKEIYDYPITRQWRPERLNVVLMHDLLDWVEQQHEAVITSRAVSKKRSA